MVRLTTRRGALGVALLLAALVGCQRGPERVPVYPVSGEVFYQGRPAAGALVIFHPRDTAVGEKLPMKPCATVGADGTFRLSTYDSGDGAPAGEYAVTVLWTTTRREEGAEGEEVADRLGGRYANPEASRLTATVQAGDNVLKRFDLR